MSDENVAVCLKTPFLFVGRLLMSPSKTTFRVSVLDSPTTCVSRFHQYWDRWRRQASNQHFFLRKLLRAYLRHSDQSTSNPQFFETSILYTSLCFKNFSRDHVVEEAVLTLLYQP